MNNKRRDFIKQSAAASAAAFLHPWAISPQEKRLHEKPAAGFELLIMATDWGFKGNREQFCAAAKKEGYDGIEVWWPTDTKGQEELFAALNKHNLKVGFLCGGWQEDVKEHLATFVQVTTDAVKNKAMKPVYVNCHSGRDYFSMEQNLPFVQHTLQLSKATAVPIYHETHRGRILFAAHIAKAYMDAVRELQLTLDISHWCNVHETMLENQPEAVALALDRTGHIHARVGHPEGPQVNDPRAPEWETIVKRHIEWWDIVVKKKKENGERITFLTEFGPMDYMPALPYTRQPVADQWAINVHMMHLLRNRYA